MSESRLSLDAHIALSRSRWLQALLADLDAHNGARFVELLHRLGASKDGLIRALVEAQDRGWVIRNAGYGHPLRPEYVLSDSGKSLARAAGKLVVAQLELGISRQSLTRWGMPIIHVIGSGEERFSRIAKVLLPATSRAISQGLQALSDNQLVSRSVVDTRPPSSLYQLTRNGRTLCDIA